MDGQIESQNFTGTFTVQGWADIWVKKVKYLAELVKSLNYSDVEAVKMKMACPFTVYSSLSLSTLTHLIL